MSISPGPTERARPVPSELTAEFWSAAASHQLVRPVCHDCGHSFFTPQVACPRCLSMQWSYQPSSGRGTIYSVTTVHRAPLPGFETPYQVAIVDLEEGWSMLANIEDEPAAIGDPVEVRFTDLGEITLPAFRVRS